MEKIKTFTDRLLELIAAIIVLLIYAFPFKWAWNYVIPYLFGLPELTWLHALCLAFLLRELIK